MKKIPPMFFTSYIIIGALLSAVILMLNQAFPIILNMASFLSPTGGKASVSGIHLKHWITGSILVFLGLLLIKESKFPKVSSFLLGFGTLLVIDELDDIYNFVTTGEL